ncbi:hypothetical protein [Reichenbachiella agariperforans]|uniref:hypothetical protein n=1 Tax=Reichenbachiella agariperforans TaxID=156994 RepID=UPI001C0A531A|nr:hypothetical protein [Reichenbachiella agariperforans]MBU2913042.1 hypothetical protein [Reichenbachiella agariperforans]
MDKLQAINQITFQLSELSALNKQHEFEHLTRHFARHKITPHILPSTGPVQAGGDQGRDFENFRTFIFKNDNSKFTGLSPNSDHKIVFCCSLQEDFQSKIKADTKSVMNFGLPVDIIYFFSNRNIDVSKRNNLKKWCVDNYNVDLEILDRQAIAENLAEYETFWIAQQFLSLPSKLILRPQAENWYDKLFSVYNSDENELTFTYEEFTEIKTAARHIYKSPDHKTDLAFWIKLMKQFAHKGPLARIRLKAAYEAIVYSAVGLLDSTGTEDLFKVFIENEKNIIDPEQIEDAANFCIFYWKGIEIGQLQDPIETALNFEGKVSKLLQTALKNAKTDDSKCYLSVVDAFWLRYNNRDLQNFVDTAVLKIGSILDLVEATPLYPVTSLSDALEKYIELFMEEESEDSQLDLVQFEELANKVAKLSAKRYGELDFAEQITKRAVLYAKKGNIIKALELFHQGKLEYYKHESLDKVIRLCLHISQSYNTLGCHFAAKYYSLIAAFIATDVSNSKYLSFFPEAMLSVASQDYSVGNWIHYLDVCDDTMLIGSHLKKDYVYSHDDINSVFFHSWLIGYIAKRFNIDAAKLVSKISDQWAFLTEDFEEADKKFTKNYDVLSDDEIKEKFCEQLSMAPFSDLGEKCSYRKRFFGIDWDIEFNNCFENRCVAEHFLTILEMQSASLITCDLYLVKNKISVTISSSDELLFQIEEHQDHVDVSIKFPYNQLSNGSQLIQDIHQKCSANIFALYYLNSLLPDVEFNEIVKSIIDKSISSEFLFITGFENLYRKYYDEKKVENRNLELHDFSPFRNQELEFQINSMFDYRESLAEIYDKEQVENHIKNRYKHSFSQIEVTLPLLNKESFFKEIIFDLHKKGFKDWHILLILANLVFSQKLDQKKIIDEGPDYFWKMARKREKEFYQPISNDLITIENMLGGWNTMTITLLHSYGLENHAKVPNFISIEKLLKTRFRLFEDDVPHKNYFK